VGITVGSKEVSDRKGLLQEMMMMMMMMRRRTMMMIIIIGLKIGGLTIKIMCSFTTKDKHTWNIIQ